MGFVMIHTWRRIKDVEKEVNRFFILVVLMFIPARAGHGLNVR